MARRTLHKKSVWDPLQLLQAFSEHGVRPEHAVKLWRWVWAVLNGWHTSTEWLQKQPLEQSN